MKNFVDDCEALIRSGQIDQVTRRLTTLNPSKIDRPWRLPIANVARRAGMISLGLKLLRPIAHPDKELAGSDPSPAEKAEYGVLLQRSGAIQDALRLLAQVDAKLVPDVLLFRAFCHFGRWEYPQAIGVLEQYLEIERRSYQRLVGSVNLASALVDDGRYKQALEQIENNIEAAADGRYGRLHGNSLELRAQIRFYEGDFAGARSDLHVAFQYLGAVRSTDNFAIRKWLAIIDAIESHELAPLLAIRQEALERRAWESVRDADRFVLKIRFDQPRFEHLYFGTPYAFFREKLRTEYPVETLPSDLVIGSQAGKVLDLANGKIDGCESPSQGIHQVIAALTRDLYRPLGMGGLFSELFPGEHFDIFSSINRLYQLIHRTRRWFMENGFDAGIVEDNGVYRLSLGESFGVRVPLERGPTASSIEERRLLDLQSRFATREFSTREACLVLGVSPSAFKILMTWALENQRVERFGKGRSTVYRLRLSSSQNRVA